MPNAVHKLKYIDAQYTKGWVKGTIKIEFTLSCNHFINCDAEIHTITQA